MSDHIIIKSLEITQPLGSFYIGVINHKDLIKIAYSDPMRRNPYFADQEDENTSIEEYLGIQRDLSPSRIRELANYVNLLDATFPTSVLLSISSKHAFFRDGFLYIDNAEHIATILDGQHRIAGLKRYTGPDDSFQINVSIFVDMDIEDQAMVFATINLKQQPMNKSLAYNLYEYSKSRSPQKTCHDMALYLSKTKNSPFYLKIKMLGKTTENKTESLSQATFVQGVIRLISSDPMQLRDQIRRKLNIKLSDINDLEKNPFRNFFLRNEDEKIMLIIWNYFSAISQKWPRAWAGPSDGYILSKSTGYSAFIKLLKEIYVSRKLFDSVPSIEYFDALLDLCDIRDDDFNIEVFLPGDMGISELYKRLYNSIILQTN